MFSGQHNFGGGKYQISAQAWKKTKKPKKIRYDLYIRKDTSEKKKENLAQRKKKQKQKKITVVNLHVRKRYVILSPLQTSQWNIRH